MAAWAIVAVPLLIMFFALGMERVEARLRQVAVGENDVEEFLERARPNEVLELFRSGMGRALELFRGRHGRGRHAVVTAASSARIGDEPTVPLAGVGSTPARGAVNGVAAGAPTGSEVTTPLPVIPPNPDQRRRQHAATRVS